jgi:glyoxylase-like metal-dependent hydrolase (beta-lactamase superfamily II)
MRKLLILLTVAMLCTPLAAGAQSLDAVAKALGAGNVKSIEIQGSGSMYQVGQAYTAGTAYPHFTARNLTRLINYDTASMREERVWARTLEPPKGGGIYIRGEHKVVGAVSGDFAWNVAGETATTAPIALVDRQFQLWSTPHGVVKAAMARKGTLRGREIAFAIPGSFRATATLDPKNMIERVDAVLANPVLGDMYVTVTYADYRDFDGVKFPTKIRQTYHGFPALDITVSEVKVNAAADITVPDSVKQAGNPYVRVTSQKAADGVWYVTGGSHHSVVIEMSDHVIVVESPLNDDRALAVLKETRTLVPNKPIKYLIVSHHHFDHAGGVRAFAGEGATLITAEGNKTYFERAVGGTTTVSPDMLMVYLPKEKLLIEADAFTPLAPGAPAMNPPSIFNVSLVDNIKKQSLAVEQILPLHGRMVPVEELHKAAGTTP